MRRGAKPGKAKVKAKPAIVRKPQKSEGAKVRDLEKRLAETLGQLQTRDGELAQAREQLATAHAQVIESREQQTATSEVLQVISASPIGLEPVFRAILQRAVSLCGGLFGVIYRFDGELIHMVAHENFTSDALAMLESHYPSPPGPAIVTSRAILERMVIESEDASDASLSPAGSVAVARRLGYRGMISVPMLREGAPIGTITVAKRERGRFAGKQVALLQTFADQAVIAIENARLLSELHQKNEALTQAHAQVTEALEQQTATSEILRVISSSPTDVQPVFDAIVRSAVRLCGGLHGVVDRFDGELIHFVAQYNYTPEALQMTQRMYPRRPDRKQAAGRAILTGDVVNIADVQADPEYATDLAVAGGWRSVLNVPMLREGKAIGTIGVIRGQAGRFSDAQVELLRTFADQAVIAIENVRLFKELENRNRDLTESLERQTATGEILKVIASTPTDLTPVFETICRSAVRLFNAYGGTIRRFDGELVYVAAVISPSPEADDRLRSRYPRRPDPNMPPDRAIVERAVIQIPDTEEDPSGSARQTARDFGYRRLVSVPMLREGQVVGSIVVTGSEPGWYSPRQIELLQTFADQAVIAIENVRLFTELQASNRELTTALDTQTATADILRVISNSPTDVQPVFDAIASSAVRLCDSTYSVVHRFDGVNIEFPVATYNVTDEQMALYRRIFPLVASMDTALGESVLARQTVHVEDTLAEGRYTSGTEAIRVAREALGYRTLLAVPMVHHDLTLGTVGLWRLEQRPFSPKQIALVETFADQAVIAIENVRLFKELEARNAALTEALDRQTATAEILRVISQSQTELQPVFDAIVDNAIRLFRGWAVAVMRSDGQLLHLVAARGGLPGTEEYLRRQSPWPVQGPLPAARSVAQRALIHIPDSESDPALDEELRDLARTRGWRSVLAAPLLRDGQPIGAITVTRAEAGPFSPAEVELLQTFADQAVIAVENARLLGELQARTTELTRSVDQLTALGEVGRAVSSTLDLETVLTTIVSRAVELSGLEGGVVFEYDDAAEEFVQRVATETAGALAEARRSVRIQKGEGVVGRTALTLEPVQVPDITVPGAHGGRLRDTLIESGVRAVLAVPMVYERRLIGSLGVTRNRPGTFPAETIELLRTFATQSALAIQNARLFREIEQKSRELEAASRHKSEFLANMSHELRTPLNAIIGYSELLEEEAGDVEGGRLVPDLQKIATAAKHQLSLINDILDLSKVEAGRMELEVTGFDLPAAIDNCLTLVRERATRRGIVLESTIDGGVGSIRADERKVKQVLLNLLSNALKFTPEGGRIDVTATMNDALVEVSVADTGVGIAPEDQEAVFEEFRQVGTADKKVEGTGLGLALARKFIELHGGRIWVTSQVGHGSTFTFTLPVRREGPIPRQ